MKRGGRINRMGRKREIRGRRMGEGDGERGQDKK